MARVEKSLKTKSAKIADAGVGEKIRRRRRILSSTRLPLAGSKKAIRYLVSLTCLMATICLSSEFLEKYQRQPTGTSLKYTHISQVGIHNFPAIGICSHFKMLRSEDTEEAKRLQDCGIDRY